MRDKVKRFISILMTALMLVNLLPVGALAEGFTISNSVQSIWEKPSANVYVYVMVDAPAELKKGLTINSSGWFTIGIASDVPNMGTPQRGKTYTLDEATKKKILDRLIPEYNEGIKLGEVKWFRLIGENGADGGDVNHTFVPAGTPTFHLDGKIKIESVPSKYTIKYVDWDDKKNVLELYPDYVKGYMNGPSQTFTAPASLKEAPYSFHYVDGHPQKQTVTFEKQSDTLTFYYRQQTVNVKYSHKNGGTVTREDDDVQVLSGKVVDGDTVKNPEDVVSTAKPKEGYVFVGWYKQNAQGVENEFVSANKDLKAGDVTNHLNKGDDGRYKSTVYQALFVEKAAVSYTVYHRDAITKENIADPETKTATSEQYAAGMISADSQQKSIAGYTYKEGTPKFIKIPIENDQNELYLDYTRNSYDYTVNYYWNGQPIKKVQTGALNTGDTKEVWPEKIEGYTPVSSEKEKITEEHKDITFYYYKNVELTANSATVPYNGSEQIVSGFTGAPEEADFSAITVGAKGTNAGKYDAIFPKNTVGTVDGTGKYIVTEATDGSLTISPRPVKLKANSGEFAYDGTPKSVSDFTCWDVATQNELTGLQFDGITASRTETNAGEYDVEFEEDPVNKKDQTKNYIVTGTEKGKLTITKVTDKVTVTITEKSGTATYDGMNHTVSGYESMTANNSLYDVEDSVDETPTANWAANGTDAGEYPVGIEAGDFKNINTNFENVEFVIVDGKLTITPAPITLQASSRSKTYDGTPLEADGYGFYEGNLDLADDIESVILTGSQTLVGSSESQITEVVTKKDKNPKNYKFTFLPGLLTVTDGTGDDPVKPENVVTKTHIPKDMGYNVGETVTFTVSVKNIYNTPKTITLTEKANVKFSNGDNAIEFTDVPAGETVTAEATYTITSADILAGVFHNTVTADFTGGGSWTAEDTVTTAELNTTLNVTKTSDVPDGQKAALGQTITYTIKVQNASNVPYTNVKVEDPLTKLTATIETLAVGETKTFTTAYVVTEADVLKGSVLNTATATGDKIKDPASDEKQKEPNGGDELEIKTFAPITLKPKDVTATYNGAAITGKDVEITSGKLLEGHKLSAAVDGSGVNAGSYALTLDPAKIKIVDANNKDVSAMYARTILPGKLIINKRSVLLTSQSATKTYDGSALTRPAVTITGDGFVPGELAKVEATGSITNVGSTPNAIQYTTTGAFNPANYSIALSVGTLTVTAKPEPEPRRTFNLTVNYVYQNGKRAAASYNRGGLKNGETFDITSPVIAGYTASETVVSGTIDNRDIKVTVIYTADGVNLDDYGVPLGLGNITMNVGDCFE